MSVLFTQEKPGLVRMISEYLSGKGWRWDLRTETWTCTDGFSATGEFATDAAIQHQIDREKGMA